MKTQQLFLRVLIVMLISVITSGAWASQPYPNQGNDVVCLNSTKHYAVVNTPGSSYAWSINTLVGGHGNIIAGQGSSDITVTWDISGTCTLTVVETTAAGCVGDPVIINVTVLPALVPGTATADQTICYNTTPAQLSSTAPTGGNGSYTYQWESSIDGGTIWTTIGGANGLTYQPGTLLQTTKFHLVQTSGSGCGTVTTNAVTITVYGNLVAGTATADQTICYNTIPSLLNSTAPAGGNGSYTYQWESSIDGGTIWTIIGGANALTYQPGALLQTTKFHVIQTSGVGCGSVTTNPITITVHGNLVAGTAAADQTICYNTIPTQLSSTAPTGGNGSYTYQWESSIDGGTIWTTIVGANGLNYQPGALLQTTKYHLLQTSGSGCGSVTTNAVTITVHGNLVAGTATADQTICYNTIPAQLSSTAPTGGNGSYTYQWESSIDGGTIWTAIGGANGLTYQPGSLLQTTKFHLVQTSGSGCGSVTTNAVTITVYANLVAGIATADQTICYNTTPLQLSSTAPTGGNGSYTYQWESSIDGGTIWTTIVGANGLNYQPGALLQTTKFHVIQTSGSGCGIVTTNAVTITVHANLVAGTATADQTICYNLIPAQLSSTPATGGNGSYTYQWESSIDGGTTWSTIGGANTLTYQPGTLTQTTLYHVVQSSGGGCGTINTNSVTITVRPQVTTSPIYHN